MWNATCIKFSIGVNLLSNFRNNSPSLMWVVISSHLPKKFVPCMSYTLSLVITMYATVPMKFLKLHKGICNRFSIDISIVCENYNMPY